MAAQGSDDVVDAARIELLAPLLGPSFAELAPRARVAAMSNTALATKAQAGAARSSTGRPGSP